MSDDEEFEEAYRAYEDGLYKDEESDESEVDSDIEECLYAQVHYSSVLTLSSTKPSKPQASLFTSTSTQNNTDDCSKESRETEPSQVKPPLIVLDTESEIDLSECEEIQDNIEPSQSDSYAEVMCSDEGNSSKTETSGTDDIQIVEETWQLDASDLLGSREKRRYYGQYGGRCHNCNERGHLSRDCPQPKKRYACFLCGDQNHERRKCPNELCFSCNKPGHKSRECSEHHRRRWDNNCKRCYVNGHVEKNCPNSWRRYHLTTKQGPLVEQTQNSKQQNIFCFNCAKKGHFGHECTKETMNRYTTINIPFIVNYGNCSTTSKNHKRRHTESSVQELRDKKDRYGNHRRHSDQVWLNGKNSHQHHRRQHFNGNKRVHSTKNYNKNGIGVADYDFEKKNKKNEVDSPANEDKRIITINVGSPPKKKRKKDRNSQKNTLPDLRVEIKGLKHRTGQYDKVDSLPDLRQSIKGKTMSTKPSERGFRSIHFSNTRTSLL